MIILSLFLLYLVNQNNAKNEYITIENAIKFTKEDMERNKQVTIQSIESMKKDGAEVSKETEKKILAEDEEISRVYLTNYESFQSKNYTTYMQNELINLQNFDTEMFLENNSSVFTNSSVVFSKYLDGKQLLNNSLLKKKLIPESTRYGTSNYMFLVSALQYITSVLGIVIFLLLFGNIHLKKIENKKMRLNFVQPISRTLMLLIDSCLFLLQSFFFLLSLILISYLIGYLFGTHIPSDYPLISLINGKVQLIPISNYILKNALLFLAVLFFSFELSQLAIIVSKNNFIAIAVVVVVLFGLGRTAQIENNTKINGSQWNPFTYIESSKLFIGKDNVQLNQNITSSINEENSIESVYFYENPAYYSGTTLSTNNVNINLKNGWIALFCGSICLLLINRFIYRKITI
ncbi:hypothetical protein ACWOFR_04545 [Carnobacterium gallinarum]